MEKGKRKGKAKTRGELDRRKRKSVVVRVMCTVQVWLVGQFGFEDETMEPMEAERSHSVRAQNREKWRVGWQVGQRVRVGSASRTSTFPVLSSASSSNSETRMKPAPPRLECGSGVRRLAHILVDAGGASQLMSSEGGVVQFMRSEGGVLHPDVSSCLLLSPSVVPFGAAETSAGPGSGTEMGCMHAAAAEKERNSLAGRRCPWRVDLRG
ncbi:hypothetical protein K438DRAFT_326061 [Mycena galopus ATCC 62051]|nr:hypothetical protein K438DRAFT_326061 [Mycena galopus ATCC 62051]